MSAIQELPCMIFSENKHLTFDPNDLDLSKNEPVKSNSGVNLHPPAKFGKDFFKDDGEKNLTFDPKDLDLSIVIKKY